MRAVRSAGRLATAVVAVLGVLGVSTAVYAAGGTTKPDFTLALSSTSASIQQGQSASTTVTVSSVGGLTGTVSLSASGLPSGATATLASSVTLSKTTPVSTPLTVQTAKTTPAGTYNVSVNGVSGTIKRSISFTLTVNYALNGSFSISAAPSAGTVSPGGTAASSVTVSAANGFTGAVAMSVHGSLPSGVSSATFTPTTVDLSSATSGTTTLELATTSGIAAGTYTIYLVGTHTSASGVKSYQYAQTALTVSTGGKPFDISVNGPVSGVSPGSSSPVDLLLTNPNAQALTVTNLTIQVSSTSAGAACAPGNFAVQQFSRYPVTVPSNGSVALSAAAGADSLPRLQMLNLSTNQDACKGVRLTLALSGTAQGN